MQGIMCYFDMLWSMCCFLFVLITVALSALNFSSYHLLPLQYLRLLIGVLSGREAVRRLYCCCYCGSMQLSAIGAFCHVFLCYLFYAHTCFSASLALIWFALSCLLFFYEVELQFLLFLCLSWNMFVVVIFVSVASIFVVKCSLLDGHSRLQLPGRRPCWHVLWPWGAWIGFGSTWVLCFTFRPGLVLCVLFVLFVLWHICAHVCVTQVLDPDAMNILTPAGYWLARDYVNRIRPEGCVWFGTPCASWAWTRVCMCALFCFFCANIFCLCGVLRFGWAGLPLVDLSRTWRAM
jgi:hypothetical protein